MKLGYSFCLIITYISNTTIYLVFEALETFKTPGNNNQTNNFIEIMECSRLGKFQHPKAHNATQNWKFCRWKHG